MIFALFAVANRPAKPPGAQGKGQKGKDMKEDVRKKLLRAGICIIRKYSATRGDKQIKVILKVGHDGKFHIMERFETKKDRDTAFKWFLEDKRFMAG